MKIYVIQETEHYWNKQTGYVSTSSSVPFVFTSKEKAVRQLNVISELNKEGVYWSGFVFESSIGMDCSYDSKMIRQDGYYHDSDDNLYRTSVFLTIKVIEANQGYAL